jgi:hypothetical protein
MKRLGMFGKSQPSGLQYIAVKREWGIEHEMEHLV